jgi:tRNA pseudouridine55 synthase
VGHAGTLDPLATGLVIVCTGKATKQITAYQDREKEYIATFELGRTTPSFDLETDTDGVFPTDNLSKELIEAALQEMTGESDQVAPVYSAKFIDGKRAYDYARKGQEVEMKPHRVTIHEMKLLECQLPVIKIRIKCSKGTYIRSIARDLGEKLENGACMIGLRRTAIGEFSVEEAVSPEEFENKLSNL